MSHPYMRVVNPSKVPPGSICRYVDPETGRAFEHPYLHQVRSLAHTFRVRNNLPIPGNWEEVFEDNVCKNTPQCPCEPVEDGAKKLFYRAQSFARSMVAFAKSGFAIAGEEVISERRATCEGLDGKPRCPQWHDAGDSYFGFGRCGACGCSTGLKSMVSSEVCPRGYWSR